MKLLIILAAFNGSAFCADPALLARGEKEEAAGCVPCHSLRIIHSQRLSKAAWGRELDKMAGWGAVVKDRDALLEYLSANFGDDKAPPTATMTADGSAQGNLR